MSSTSNQNSWKKIWKRTRRNTTKKIRNLTTPKGTNPKLRGKVTTS